MMNKTICATSIMKEKQIVHYHIVRYVMILVGIVVISIIIINGIIEQEPINLVDILDIIFLVSLVYFTSSFFIHLFKNPTVTEDGISLPFTYHNLIDKSQFEDKSNDKIQLRYFCSWNDVSVFILENSTTEWKCTFQLNYGLKIIITSQMGYTKECLNNLIELSEELKRKGIEVKVSNTAVQIENE